MSAAVCSGGADTVVMGKIVVGVIDGGPLDWSDASLAPHAGATGVCEPRLRVPVPGRDGFEMADPTLPTMKDVPQQIEDMLEQTMYPALADRRHGTHVASIATKNTHFTLAFETEEGIDTLGAKVDALVAQGARVINMSFAMRTAVNTERMREIMIAHPNVTFVVAAGNAGVVLQPIDDDNFNTPLAPADNIIVVAAADDNDSPTEFTNVGAESVQVAAHGKDIEAARYGGGTTKMSGTSMAAPAVTRIVGRMLEANPRLKPAELRFILMHTSMESTEWRGLVAAEGVVDEERAVALAKFTRKADAHGGAKGSTQVKADYAALLRFRR